MLQRHSITLALVGGLVGLSLGACGADRTLGPDARGGDARLDGPAGSDSAADAASDAAADADADDETGFPEVAVDALELSGCAAGFAGCNSTTDLTGQTAVRIEFGSAGFSYAPKCIRIRVGTVVTFAGQFSFHPLVQACGPKSGVITGGTGTNDHNVTFSDVGRFGYYCSAHGTKTGLSMAGMIEVVP